MSEFRAEMERAGAFIKLMDVIATMVSDGILRVSEKGITLRAMDPSHVCSIDLKLTPEFFGKSFTPGKLQDLKIDFIDLTHILKRLSATDTLKLTKDVSNNKLRIQTVGNVTRTFRIGLIAFEEGDEKDPPTPRLDLNGHCSVKSADFTRAIKDAKIFADYAQITLTDSLLIIAANGDTGDVASEISELQELQVKGTQTSMYSLEYLVDIMKVDAVSDLLLLEFSSDLPVKITAQLEHDSVIQFLLAPRVEGEDEDEEDVGAGESEPEDSDEEDMV